MSIYALLYKRFGQKSEHNRIGNARQRIDEYRKKLPTVGASPNCLSGKTVIIVGAGFAGLSAAVWLKR